MDTKSVWKGLAYGAVASCAAEVVTMGETSDPNWRPIPSDQIEGKFPK